jgi:hypothetical protein
MGVTAISKPGGQVDGCSHYRRPIIFTVRVALASVDDTNA